MGEPFVKRACGTGPVTWYGSRAGEDRFAGFLAGAGVRAAARSGVKLERPQRKRPVRARVRTNELEAGKRRPTIGSEEPACGYGLAGVGVCWGWLAGWCAGRRSGLTSTHSAPAREGRV